MEKHEVENFLKQKVFKAAEEYLNYTCKFNKDFKPGDRISYAGRVFDNEEVMNLIDASLEFWLTSGRYTEQFESTLAKFLGVKYCSMVNSGSSANLIAFMTLTSPVLGERRIRRDDEVITVAAGFPTTIAPIVQFGAIPVFVDITLPEYNIDCSQLEAALSSRTKAVMLAHTLGNPFNLKTVKEFCEKHSLWLIEDNCDALGSKYFIDGEWKSTGAIGHIGTSSFYPPHHITTGEGGAVYTNDPLLHKLILSFRDWGRDCWCPSGKDNTCRCRFEKQFGELPYGYDHKYVYSHLGYNLKATDMQAAIGCAQLKKLPKFIDIRKHNWMLLKDGLKSLQDKLILPEPTINSDPSWFGFLLTIKENQYFKRDEILDYLESHNIQTRMLFAGNIIKHPCFNEMRETGKGYRIVGELKNTDTVMEHSFWIGVYPGITDISAIYIINVIKDFFKYR